MAMVFSKKRMLERLEKEGRTEEVTPEMLEVMDCLDGGEAVEQCWNRVVKGEPVFFVNWKNGRPASYSADVSGEYVNENDCISR